MTRHTVLSLILLGAAVGCDRRIRIEDSVTSGAGPGGDGPTTTTGAGDATTGSVSVTTTASSSQSGSGGASGGAVWDVPATVALDCGSHTATATTAGHALIVGACFLVRGSEPCTSSESANALDYDYAARSFTTIALQEPRTMHAAARLADGRVALVGDAPNVEYVDPSTETTELGPQLIVPRTEPMLTVLPDGRLWVLGGFAADGTTLASTEIVDPVAMTSTLGPPLAYSRARAATLGFGGEGVWVGGGESVATPNSDSEFLTGSEEADSTLSLFKEGPPLVGVAEHGDVSAVRSAGHIAVFGVYSLAWGDGSTFASAIPYTGTLFRPASTVTQSGRFFAAGMHVYSGEMAVLEATPANGAHVVATKPAGSAMTSITPLTNATLLVISGQAALLQLQ